MGAYRWTQRQMVTWSTARFRSAMISSRSRYVNEYRRYHRTHRRMITFSKCRPRNSAGRFRVTATPYKTARPAFETEPTHPQWFGRHRGVKRKGCSRQHRSTTAVQVAFAAAVRWWSRYTAVSSFFAVSAQSSEMIPRLTGAAEDSEGI